MNTLTGTTGIQRFVQRLHRRDLFIRSPGTNRHIATDFSLAHHRYRIGPHPIMDANLDAIIHDATPGLAFFQREPHIRKRRFWHIRVTHHVVRLPL